MALESKIFTIPPDQKLKDCAENPSGHISQTANNQGGHVSRIQTALRLLAQTEPNLAVFTNKPEFNKDFADRKYGKGTADAVLNYKIGRVIIDRSRQTQADNIVGKMTIDWLDNEMKAFEKGGGGKPNPNADPAPITQSTEFEIRVVGGFTVSKAFLEVDFYFFQIVDLARKQTAFYQYIAGGLSFSLRRMIGNGSVTKTGPPTKFSTTSPVELYQFNTNSSLAMAPGATAGGLSVGGTLKLWIMIGGVYTNPGRIFINGGWGIATPSLGSSTSGILAKVSADFPFTGY